MNLRTATPPEATDADAPGRSCPLHYRYRPEDFRTPPPPHLDDLDTLYVVGGLYGNELALDTLEQLLQRQAAHDGRRAVVFNGDFHWFDAEPAWFERVQRRVLAHTALRGNVETELAAEPPDAGDGRCRLRLRLPGLGGRRGGGALQPHPCPPAPGHHGRAARRARSPAHARPRHGGRLAAGAGAW
jgi:hypothetical protein